MKTLKFCDYIQSIKKDFEKGDTYLFVRFTEKDIHLIKNIVGKKVFSFEISQSRWEEVEWKIEDDDRIYPIRVWNIIKKLK